MESICRQIEGHLQSLHQLVNDVKEIGHATLCSNRRIPSTNYNHAMKVNCAESDADKLIADVVAYYRSMGLVPCFMISPATRPAAFASFLQKAGFQRVLEEDVMVHRGKSKVLRLNPAVEVAVNNGSLIDTWTDVSMRGFQVPTAFREALIDMYRKASNFKGTRSYLGYFQGKPAGSCGLVSINDIGGIFSVATPPEYRRKGVATALLNKALADSLSAGNSLLYLITAKGSDAERLYLNLGFEVAYTHYRYELHSQRQ